MTENNNLNIIFFLLTEIVGVEVLDSSGKKIFSRVYGIKSWINIKSLWFMPMVQTLQ